MRDSDMPRGDARGFVYALAPYRHKQQWGLQRLEQELARAAHELADAMQQHALLESVYEQQTQILRSLVACGPNPGAHRQGLLFLADLVTQIGQSKTSLEALHAKKDSSRAACMAQQLRLNELEEHRLRAHRTFVDDRARNEAVEADRDWMGRTLRSRSHS